MSAPFGADLLEAAKAGDAKAAEELVEENSGLIWSIARRYFGRGVDADDLFQLGCVGLVKAIRGYDGAYGTRFSTYAVPKISGEIRRFLRDDGAVKVSRGVKERAAAIRNARNELSAELGREPVLSEISERTGISPEDIAVAETATSTADSLQRSAGEDGLTLENVLGDWSAEERLLERVSLREALERLGARERQVVALRFYRGMTQAEAAKVLSVSQVQVSRIERRAIEALRESLEEK